MTPRAATISSGAAVVAALTLLSRVLGLVRQLVFQAAIGATLLGTVYTTANSLPNIVFEIVAGGALAGSVVPLVAGAFARGDLGHVRAIANALVTWIVVVLVPLTAVAMAIAPQLATLLLRGVGGPDAQALCVLLLRCFLPQVPLYGLAVVSGALLQGQRRFAPAAVGPMLSSLVLIVVYLGFARAVGVGEEAGPIGALPDAAVLWLGYGTTCAVLAMTLVSLVPMLRSRLWVRPAFRFPPGVARQAAGLAVAGLATVGAQQVTTMIAIPLANGRGPVGGLVTYQYAQLLMMLPYAVLAFPIATAAFPQLAATAEAGDDAGFATMSARTTRSVIVTGALGAAILVAAARPLARFFGLFAPSGSGAGQSGAYPELAHTLVALAPTVAATGLILLLGRTLMARHRGPVSARGTAVGWAMVIVWDLVLTAVVPESLVIPALGLGMSAGLGVGVFLLWQSVRREAGPAAVAGSLRTGAVATAAAIGAGFAGWATGGALVGPSTSMLPTIGAGVAAAGVATVLFVALVAAGDRGALRGLRG